MLDLLCPGTMRRWLAVACLVASSVTYDAVRAAEVNGQSHFMLEVARQALVEERVKALRAEVADMLRDAGIERGELAVGEMSIEIPVADAAEGDKIKSVLAPLLAPVEGAGGVVELSLQEAKPGLVAYQLTEAGIDYRAGLAALRSVDVIKRRLGELGIDRPVVEKQAAARILVDVTGSHDPNHLKETLLRPARLSLQWVDQSMPVEQALSAGVPAGSSVLYSSDQLPFLIEDHVVISGDHIVDAQAGFDQFSNSPVISFRFDAEGRGLFGKATQENVGRQLAVILDGQVLMAPKILEPILGGSGQISGAFTTDSANDLALLLRAGALPVKLDIVEERFKPTTP